LVSVTFPNLALMAARNFMQVVLRVGID